MSQLRAFQLYIAAADLREFVLSLLHKPAVFGDSKTSGSLTAFREMQRFPLTEFRKRVARTQGPAASIISSPKS